MYIAKILLHSIISIFLNIPRKITKIYFRRSHQDIFKHKFSNPLLKNNLLHIRNIRNYHILSIYYCNFNKWMSKYHRSSRQDKNMNKILLVRKHLLDISSKSGTLNLTPSNMIYKVCRKIRKIVS